MKLPIYVRPYTHHCHTASTS